MAIDTRIWGNRASSPQDPRGYFYDTAHLSLISPGFRLLGRNRAFVPPLFATPYFYALFWRPVSRVRSSCRDGLASGSNLPDTARNGGDTPPSSTQWASLSVRLRPARLLYGDLRRLWSVFLDFLSISSYMAGGSARPLLLPPRRILSMAEAGLIARRRNRSSPRMIQRAGRGVSNRLPFSALVICLAVGSLALIGGSEIWIAWSQIFPACWGSWISGSISRSHLRFLPI